LCLFGEDELLASHTKLTATRLHFGDITVDRDTFSLLKNGRREDLTPRAFDVLVYLIEHRGRVVEKQELFEHVWKESFVTDNALTRAVKEIRRALGDDADSPRYIETAHRRGYRFIAEVEELNGQCTGETEPSEIFAKEEAGFSTRAKDETLLVVAEEEGTPGRPTPPRRLHLGGLALFGGLAALLLIAFVIWRTQTRPDSAVPGGLVKSTQITFSAGLDNFSALSPDGNSIAYSSDHGGRFEIYVKQFTPGGQEIQLTSDGQQNLEPAWSPDGQRVAYHSVERGGIWNIPALGGVPKRLTDFGSRPAWSPDGAFIAFQSAALTDLGSYGRNAMPPSTIWIVPAKGGPAGQLTQQGDPPGGHGAPAWSPDGKRILFSADDFLSSSIWSISSQGGGLRQILPAVNAAEAIYSPDGKYIYYTGSGAPPRDGTFSPRDGSTMGLWKVRISPSDDETIGEPVLVFGGPPVTTRYPTISADGKKIAYSTLLLSSNLWSVSMSPGTGEAAGPPVPFTHDTSSRNNLPAFSPDGQKLAFVSWRTGTSGDIWVADADGKHATQLTTSPAIDTIPDWLPGGEQIAFFSNRDNDHLTLWTTTLTGAQDRPLIDLGRGVEFARLSPDGRRVAFNSKAGGTINVWVSSVEGGQPVQLTFDKELMAFPCWSPDGKYLAFAMKRGDDQYVAVIPSDGGTPMQLTAEHGLSWVYGWSPDGSRIAFAGFRDGYWNIFWVSRDGKTEKQLTGYAKMNTFARYPAWSPLGDRIVYEHAETTGNIWLMELK
jgi:Tol biopolymer transport system component/DNA-binding winged helix-turn-helix (wHTH) protein